MNKEKKIDIILRKTSQTFNEESIRKKLASDKKAIIKFGCDPSRPDLHLGHSVALRALRIMQELGHEIVFVIGDFTAMIGDPSLKSATRKPLTFEETRKSGETYFRQVTKILDKDKTRIEYNSSWLSKLNFHDILDLTGKYTLARILERDDFKKRFKENSSIGIHELLYPLIQGYDSVAIKADIEVGGSDQTFNLHVGRELQKDYEQEPQDLMIFPLLVGLDGVDKMSKSLGNYIGIDESPEIMYEKAMTIPDNVLEDYFKLTTDLDMIDVTKELEKDIFNAHKIYAGEIIKMYHGEEYIKQAQERYDTVSKGGIPSNIKEIYIKELLVKQEINILDLLLEIKFIDSKSEGRRLINQNGISLNQVKVNDITKNITLEDFKEGYITLQKGKNHFLKLLLEK